MNYTTYAYLKQQNIHGSTKTILRSLLWHCRDKNWCFPSVKTLVKATELSESTVHRGIKNLVKYDILEVVYRHHEDGGKNRSNIYVLKALRFEDESKNYRHDGCHSDTHKIISIGNKSYARDGVQEHSPSALQSTKSALLENQKPSIFKTKSIPRLVYGHEHSTCKEINTTFDNDRPINYHTEVRGCVKQKSRTQRAVKKDHAVRFTGHLDLDKVLEIFNLYTSHGWLRKCVADFIDFSACCSALNRIEQEDLKRPSHRKRIKNKWGLLTYLTKNRKLLDKVNHNDDEKARKALTKLRMDDVIDF